MTFLRQPISRIGLALFIGFGLVALILSGPVQQLFLRRLGRTRKPSGR